MRKVLEGMSATTKIVMDYRRAHLSDKCNLLPCPFCGTNRTSVHEWLFGSYVFCECGAHGPHGFGENPRLMAITMWNQRGLTSIPSKDDK